MILEHGKMRLYVLAAIPKGRGRQDPGGYPGMIHRWVMLLTSDVTRVKPAAVPGDNAVSARPGRDGETAAVRPGECSLLLHKCVTGLVLPRLRDRQWNHSVSLRLTSCTWHNECRCDLTSYCITSTTPASEWIFECLASVPQGKPVNPPTGEVWANFRCGSVKAILSLLVIVDIISVLVGSLFDLHEEKRKIVVRSQRCGTGETKGVGGEANGNDEVPVPAEWRHLPPPTSTPDRRDVRTSSSH
ncbi:hypothetical protein J6590_020478 [Homalodisca vitripennis]|nr:hypothetical protein J6590_020478 [Homalodisca vitripennis]